MATPTVEEVAQLLASARNPLFDLKECGQKLTLHSLRHAFASHCYANGMDLPVLNRLLGHSQLSATVLYVDCSWDQCQTSDASCHP